jgi:hypothetical protein
MSEEALNSPVLEIVEWIDSKQTFKGTAIVRSGDGLRGRMNRPFLWLVVLFFIVWLGVYEYSVNLAFKGQYNFDTFVLGSSTLLAASAVILAGMSLMQPFMGKNETEVRYKRALNVRKMEVERRIKPKIRDFTDDEKPILKALVEILGKNEGFTLKQLYDLDKTKSIFSEEKLLERILD